MAPDMYNQACVNQLTDMSAYSGLCQFSGLRLAGPLGPGVDDSGGSTYQRDGVNVISAMWVVL